MASNSINYRRELPVTDWPVYWFARLEKAIEEGDHQIAAEAQRQLARLGVKVQYGRKLSHAQAVKARA